MTRLRGTRNTNYVEARMKLVDAIRVRLLKTGSDQVSFREMAKYAGVSVPTLRHYFGKRTLLVKEVFAQLHRDGLPYLEAAGTSDTDLEMSMQEAADMMLAGVRFGRMDKVHSRGLIEGLGDSELGPWYLDSILEPSLQALEHRLDGHRERGELATTSTRNAALAFAAPLILAALHQFGLGGDCVRPLDLSEFAKDHVQAFVRGYGVLSTKRRVEAKE